MERDAPVAEERVVDERAEVLQRARGAFVTVGAGLAHHPVVLVEGDEVDPPRVHGDRNGIGEQRHRLAQAADRLLAQHPVPGDGVDAAVREAAALAQTRAVGLGTAPGVIVGVAQLDDAIAGADFVTEAVYEDLALKQDLFERISRQNPTAVATISIAKDGTIIDATIAQSPYFS